MIIVEDGTVVPNANSYVSLEDFKLMAAQYTELDPLLVDDELTRIILRAMLFIERLAFKGTKVDFFHTVQWPRADLCFAPYTMWPEDKVPPQIIQALVLLSVGVVIEGDEVLTPPQNTRREKVGQVEVEFYSNGGVGTESVWQQQAIDLLRPFAMFMRTVRV